MASAPAFEQLRREQMDKLITRLLILRMRAAPFALGIITWFAWTDSARWRRYGMVAIFLLATAVQAATLIQVRRQTEAGKVIGWNVAIMSVALLSALVFTGGVDSPIAPAVLFFCTILPLMLPVKLAAGALLIGVAGIIKLTIMQASGWFQHAIPDVLGGGAYTGSRAMVIMRGTFLATTTMIGLFVTLRVRRAFEETAERAISAREEALADHAEQNRTLMLVAGEIAHELKNPLASIKGLASMVAREVAAHNLEKPTEQMAVLRREVNRMHNILEEFLNFSRPLVPLTVAPVELADLCDDVAHLHASIAAEHDIDIEVAGARSARIWADRRKVKQVLVNLVQNALDASPRRGTVTLTVEHAEHDGASAVRVRVRDQGAGLAPEVAERVFEAGVTTKARGSGLGLTLSRALARQHGGDLTLADAPGGGCVAELILPVEAKS
jgi:two-component system, NtrC family, sensor histidine kinase HydH